MTWKQLPAAPVAFVVAALCTSPAAALDAGEVVGRMVDAHGGMAPFDAAPSVTFSDEWNRPGSDEGRRSVVQVEQGTRRAILEFPAMNATIAWNGKEAWSVNWSGAPPRFLALLDYYFVCLPWMAQDPGVVLHEPGGAKLWDDPVEYVTVRMTFGQGVGDTPDDYYVLYIDPQSHRLHACEYVVTYPGLVPEGMEHTPAHILVYDTYETVDHLVVPTHFTIYGKDHSVYAACTVSDWSFKKPFDASRLEMPVGAVVDHSMDSAEDAR